MKSDEGTRRLMMTFSSRGMTVLMMMLTSTWLMKKWRKRLTTKTLKPIVMFSLELRAVGGISFASLSVSWSMVTMMSYLRWSRSSPLPLVKPLICFWLVLPVPPLLGAMRPLRKPTKVDEEQGGAETRHCHCRAHDDPLNETGKLVTRSHWLRSGALVTLLGCILAALLLTIQSMKRLMVFRLCPLHHSPLPRC